LARSSSPLGPTTQSRANSDFPVHRKRGLWITRGRWGLFHGDPKRIVGVLRVTLLNRLNNSREWAELPLGRQTLHHDWLSDYRGLQTPLFIPRTGSFLQPKCQRLKPHAAPEKNEKSGLSETRSTMQSGSLFRLLMIGCVGEVARGASGTAESSQQLSASLRRMTRESPARIRAAG
jgi:hypothetical protein